LIKKSRSKRGVRGGPSRETAGGLKQELRGRGRRGSVQRVAYGPMGGVRNFLGSKGGSRPPEQKRNREERAEIQGGPGKGGLGMSRKG